MHGGTCICFCSGYKRDCNLMIFRKRCCIAATTCHTLTLPVARSPALRTSAADETRCRSRPSPLLVACVCLCKRPLLQCGAFRKHTSSHLRFASQAYDRTKTITRHCYSALCLGHLRVHREDLVKMLFILRVDVVESGRVAHAPQLLMRRSRYCCVLVYVLLCYTLYT